MLDALAFGLPIIATIAGGIPEIIEDKVNGYLCEVDDTEALCDAMMALYRDAELRARISAINARKAEQFSPENMTRRYIDVYKRLIDKEIKRKAEL